MHALEPRGPERDDGHLRALPGVAVADDVPLGIDPALPEQRGYRLSSERPPVGPEQVRPLEVDGALDVSLARVARIAGRTCELLLRANVQHLDRAVLERERELVARHATASSSKLSSAVGLIGRDGTAACRRARQR